jgi:hypothetical protein
MGNFAVIDDEVVVNVIVADSLAIAQEVTGLSCVEVQDSENVYIGLGYYAEDHKFITQPKPFPSWIIDEDYNWVAPTSKPTDGRTYAWQEISTSWVETPKFPSWSFDTVTKKYVPPVPYPTDGELYGWEEDLQEWVITDGVIQEDPPVA